MRCSIQRPCNAASTAAWVRVDSCACLQPLAVSRLRQLQRRSAENAASWAACRVLMVARLSIPFTTFEPQGALEQSGKLGVS